MHRSRHVIAVTLVAAALCADRVAVAAPVLPVQHKTTATERLVIRLTSSFRRVIPAVKVIVARCDGRAVEFVPTSRAAIAVRPQPVSPFQFRLPPPLA